MDGYQAGFKLLHAECKTCGIVFLHDGSVNWWDRAAGETPVFKLKESVVAYVNENHKRDSPGCDKAGNRKMIIEFVNVLTEKCNQTYGG